MVAFNFPVLVAWGPGPAVAGWMRRRLPGCRGSVILLATAGDSQKLWQVRGSEGWVGMSQEGILSGFPGLL